MINKEQLEELGWNYVDDNGNGSDIYVLGKKKVQSIFSRTPHLEIKEDKIMVTRGYSSYQGVPQGVIFNGKLLHNTTEEMDEIMKQIGIKE